MPWSTLHGRSAVKWAILYFASKVGTRGADEDGSTVLLKPALAGGGSDRTYGLRNLADKLAAARENNRFADRRIADLEARTVDMQP